MPKPNEKLIRPVFFASDPRQVAKQLIGKRLVSTIGGEKSSGIIVETEAYLSKGDSASHGFKGPNNKNGSMFGPAGHAYVYPIHAKYCFNVVTEENEFPSAVLIRAIKPIENIEIMATRRNLDTSQVLAIASGPAKLCQALGIDRTIDGAKLDGYHNVWIEHSSESPSKPPIKATVRIGVTSATEKKLRFVLVGSPFASGPKYLR